MSAVRKGEGEGGWKRAEIVLVVPKVWPNPPGESFDIERRTRDGRVWTARITPQSVPLSVSELASVLQVSRPTVHRWVNEGTVKFLQRRGTTRIPFAEVYRLLVQYRGFPEGRGKFLIN